MPGVRWCVNGIAFWFVIAFPFCPTALFTKLPWMRTIDFDFVILVIVVYIIKKLSRYRVGDGYPLPEAWNYSVQSCMCGVDSITHNVKSSSKARLKKTSAGSNLIEVVKKDPLASPMNIAATWGKQFTQINQALQPNYSCGGMLQIKIWPRIRRGFLSTMWTLVDEIVVWLVCWGAYGAFRISEMN